MAWEKRHVLTGALQSTRIDLGALAHFSIGRLEFQISFNLSVSNWTSHIGYASGSVNGLVSYTQCVAKLQPAHFEF